MLTAGIGLKRGPTYTSLVMVMATVGAAAAAGLAILFVDRGELVPMAVALLVLIILVHWRLELGIWVFILATALNRYNFGVAGWNMKIEHMVLLLILVVWGLRLLSMQERLKHLPTIAIIGGFLGICFVASVFNSPDLYKSLRILTRMSLAVLAYVLIVNHIRGRSQLWRLVTVFLAVAGGVAVYGVVASAVWHFARINIGLQFSTINGVWSPYGTMWEGNIFGGYVMSACVASLVLLISGQHTIKRWFLLTVFATTGVAMLLSMARASWLGFGVAVFLVLLIIRKFRFRNLTLVVAGSAPALFFLGSTNPGGVFQSVWDRLASFQTVSQDLNIISRLTTANLALQEWWQSPWIGWGVDGFHINHPEIFSSLPSPQLNALYDTGVLGFLLFVAMILALIGRAFAAARNVEDGPDRALLLALLISFLGLFVAFQATNAFWLGFTWVHLSLLTGAVSVAESKGREFHNCGAKTSLIIAGN